jgi:transposase-like protein
MILRAFIWDEELPMRTIAESLGISPTTLYKTLRLAVKALMLIRQGVESVDGLVDRIRELQEQLIRVEQARATAQIEVQRLTKALVETRARIVALEDKVRDLQEQWKIAQDRLIVVLKMEGRCTVRSIVAVLEYGLGIHVSVGYVQGIITQASTNAWPALQRLRDAVPLSGAISIDEVFFKEMAHKILGVAIVDPLSGLILHFERCEERSKEAIGEIIKNFAEAGFEAHIKLCLTDMYAGYVEPVKAYLSKAVHQFCWFHINCFHIGATVLQAKRAYTRTVKKVACFDKKHACPLSTEENEERQALITIRDLAQCHWRGAQRFQRLLMRLLWSRNLDEATARLNQLIRVAAKMQNPYVKDMGDFLDRHRPGLLVFYQCLESDQHTLRRLSQSRGQWVPLVKRWAVPITSNAAEHVFRCLRRYTNQMDHFGTKEATQRFFDLFAFHYNLRVLRSGKREGNSLLAAAHVNVVEIFGTDDPYTILGFPPAYQSFESVQSTTNQK